MSVTKKTRKAPQRGFSNDELLERLNSIQTRMSQSGVGALLLTTEADIYYFTGFLSQFWQSPTRPWFVVVPATGKPIAIIPEIGGSCMNNGFMEDIRTWSSPHPTDDGVSLLASSVIEVLENSNDKKLGFNQGRETHLRMPLSDYQQLCELLKNKIELVDATEIIRQQRMVKSETEIDKIRYVAQCASDVFESPSSFAQTGMRTEEVFRAFKIACLNAGVDDVSFLVGGANQGGYDDIISPPTSRALTKGDVLILDTGCTFDGYFCDFDRNYGIESASNSALKAYDVLWQATEAGLAAAKPGNRCCDIFNAMNDVMAAGGALGESVGRFGHGLGIQLTEPPSHTSWDQTVLESGMVITLEPGMFYEPDKMMVHEENLVIRDQTPELLSRRAAPEMPII